MAILSKIRERSLFLILIIGLALFAFVASPRKLMNFFRSKKAGLVAEINGEKISRNQFQSMIKRIKSYNPKAKDDQITEQVWNDLVKEKIYTAQLEKAGIEIGEKDLWDAIINDPSIKNSPQFKNEVGMFSEDMLRNYIQDLKDNRNEDGGRQWASWLAFEDGKRKELRQQIYLNLIKSGINTTTPEAYNDYLIHNTTVSGKLIKIPYRTIPDSTIVVNDTDIQNYMNKHPKEFQVDATRSIRFVVFDLKASEEDKNTLKKELEGLLPDFKKLEGEKLIEFVDANSDTGYKDVFVTKESLNKAVADTLFSLNKGEVYGPYEDKDYYKISKLIDIKPVFQAKASHILIAYKGSKNAKADITRSKEEAKAKAQKLLRKVNAKNFADMARENSDGPSATRGGSLGTFGEGRMVPAFNDWVFSHKKGDIGMVETEFGFHIIYLEDTFQGRKFATISKLIQPSEETENKIFIDAETLVSEVNKGKDFKELAKEKKYLVKKAANLKKRDSRIAQLDGSNSHIVSWTFNDDTKVGDVKRFQIDKAYVVVQLTGKQEKGMMNITDAAKTIKPTLIKEKKAEILSKRLQGNNLKEIADRENLKILNTGNISLENPNKGVLGADNDIVIGAMLGMNEGEMVTGIKGNNAVYAVELVKKTPPVELDTYEAIRKRLASDRTSKINNNTVFEALKESADIKDYR